LGVTINALLRREVEERRRAETDLRQAQDDLVHAAKLATLGPEPFAAFLERDNRRWAEAAAAGLVTTAN